MMTGVPKMDTAAFREYFAPLEKWLTKYNKDKNNWVSKLDQGKNSDQTLVDEKESEKEKIKTQIV